MSAFAMTSIKVRYSAMVTSSKARSDLATLKCCIDGPQRWRRAPGVCSWLDPFRCRNVPGLGEPGPGEPAEGPASARAVSPCSFSVQSLVRTRTAGPWKYSERLRRDHVSAGALAWLRALKILSGATG